MERYNAINDKIFLNDEKNKTFNEHKSFIQMIKEKEKLRKENAKKKREQKKEKKNLKLNNWKEKKTKKKKKKKN